MSQKNLTWLLILIIVLAILAAFFIYPKDLGNKFRPWRLGLDLVGGTRLIYEIDISQAKEADKSIVLGGLRDVIEKRVNLFGVSEPVITTAKSGDTYRLIVELAGVKDVKKAIEEVGSTPLLDFREVIVPEEEKELEKIIFIPTDLTGRYIKGAQLEFDSITNQPAVGIQFDNEGAKIFEQLTERNIGKYLAIFLDNGLIEMPVVKEKISGGQARITGKFTIEEAKKLVERFNAGALTAPINLISQETVGASLGEESLQKTLKAGLIGIILILLFMGFYYRRLGLGWFSGIAFLIYILLTLAVYKIFGATMTLAGIAGFILSIGMAVDANVLIFEGIKEGFKKGLNRISSIDEGFRKAWSSIRDSNITSIITCLILYNLTSGFIKGFALTLLIGVLVSMFSAIFVTRTILRVFVRK
ncbi:protein translocase subunit SecD [Candidatus Wolfebacteria bacterium CG03_land_8_20_14_0_80_36_15]|uniref:Protein translocase subunit SecD n=1 Tax=Candidatus Wolfebacteria bacterium CG03_land_8_20_14_0_80_36_15 TaxID=1975067 RepID=A0A2M7B7L1_9BACT|nr:MAG: protein translocase subunit SecD [Candidatus Wolfebacteria bacterium CG03_land_8_20_14_0_80_36_15]